MPLSASAASSAWPPDGKTLAEHGTSQIPSCASCHGARFEGDRKSAAPALAGKDAADMMDQLYAMATNPKNHSEMAEIARKLDMAERAAVTAWLSRLPAKP
ncbi:MAG: c-type cytochrome [Gemmataceae bacterium]